MCGIAGFIDLRRATTAAALAATAEAMADRLRHRGPDDSGTWVDAATGVALANRRLAVRDLSPAGHQPMTSADGRYVLTYNGEIYDADERRAELLALGARFRGTSDTEVLLNACMAWGAEAAVRRLNGMFAFALWDTVERRLTMGRDRLGIKPLYWLRTDTLFAFASEITALRAHPGWSATIDPDALAAFARLSYVPQPLAIYRGVRKLAPGTVLVLSPDTPPRITRYWDMADVARQERLALSAEDAAFQLEALLRRSVRRHLISDVPVGVFLSGGIDSSTVAALMQAEQSRPIKTFTVGFAEAGFDEAAQARRIATALGTDHREIRLDPREALALVPSIAGLFDEPFADSSQIPTLLVSQAARADVTVALSGDGGDEVFGGYNRYLWAAGLGRRMNALPLGLRRFAARVLDNAVPVLWAKALRPIVPQADEKVRKIAAILALDDPDRIYDRLTETGDATIVPNGRAPELADAPHLADAVERMQYRDSISYLPDDILTKVDRTSMAVSLEVRVPLLDHDVVEFAWRLPRELKVANGVGKRVLRTVLERYVPAHLFAGRPKQGFAVPLGSWLRGPLRDFAETHLSEGALSRSGMFDVATIRGWWDDHRVGRRDRHHALWSVIVFNAWREAEALRSAMTPRASGLASP
ncbi:MAG: asparagine synthase (glutamine-hydrolyzing) [Rhodospirillales bacterium]|nr:asparagine synthase (glutamine-hydrolyzing) [Rhodospirillales bacterium]